MKRSLYWILVVIVALGVAVAWQSFTGPSSETHAQQQEQSAESSGSAASALSQATAVTLTAAEQKRLGVKVAVLASQSAQRRITAPAVVLSAQSLVSARDGFVAAQARLETAQVSLGVAQKELARIKTLYRDSQNVSLKDLQSAQGAVDSDAIDVRAARMRMSLETSLVRQSWGGVVAKWVADSSPALGRVLAQKATLVEVSLPDGQRDPQAPTVWLAPGGPEEKPATFVSPLPRVDPRVQGKGLLYLAPAWSDLAPGVTLIARLPVGRRLRGVAVPASAIVWFNGVSWVYAETASGSFRRLPVATDFPTNGGYFVSQGLRSGEKIAAEGAEMLLSAEQNPPGSSSGDSDGDD